MSSINPISSSSSNAAAIAYQEMLARQLAQKQALKKNAETASGKVDPSPAPAGDVDHDGDSH